MSHLAEVQHSNRYNQIQRVGIAAASGLLALTAGYVIRGEVDSPETTAIPSAAAIEAQLNYEPRVAESAVVEVGYMLPFSADLTGPQGPEEAYAISNPLKLGETTYGYIDPVALQKDGEVVIKTVEYMGELFPNTFETHNKAYPHEVTTPLAVTYNDSAYQKAGRYYAVIMGDKSGNTDSLMNTVPGISAEEYDREVAEQGGELALAQAGEIIYATSK